MILQQATFKAVSTTHLTLTQVAQEKKHTKLQSQLSFLPHPGHYSKQFKKYRRRYKR